MTKTLVLLGCFLLWVVGIPVSIWFNRRLRRRATEERERVRVPPPTARRYNFRLPPNSFTFFGVSETAGHMALRDGAMRGVPHIRRDAHCQLDLWFTAGDTISVPFGIAHLKFRITKVRRDEVLEVELLPWRQELSLWGDEVG